MIRVGVLLIVMCFLVAIPLWLGILLAIIVLMWPTGRKPPQRFSDEMVKADDYYNPN